MLNTIATMGRNRILKDTVILHNSLGEIEDRNVYQDTILTSCYCPIDEGTDLTNQGKKSNNSAKLYLFDFKTKAKSVNGSIRTYLPYDKWVKLTDKSKYWTLNPNGDDYFTKEGCRKVRIIKFSHKVAGSRRMWHFEVEGI